MNDSKTLSATPPTMSAIEQEVDNINHQLSRVEKAISGCMEHFRRFDVPANKINPDDFFRNIPEVLSSGENSGISNKTSENYVKSGLVLKLSELGSYAKQLEKQLDDFKENHISTTAQFFERNV